MRKDDWNSRGWWRRGGKCGGGFPVYDTAGNDVGVRGDGAEGVGIRSVVPELRFRLIEDFSCGAFVLKFGGPFAGDDCRWRIRDGS